MRRSPAGAPRRATPERRRPPHRVSCASRSVSGPRVSTRLLDEGLHHRRRRGRVRLRGAAVVARCPCRGCRGCRGDRARGVVVVGVVVARRKTASPHCHAENRREGVSSQLALSAHRERREEVSRRRHLLAGRSRRVRRAVSAPQGALRDVGGCARHQRRLRASDGAPARPRHGRRPRAAGVDASGAPPRVPLRRVRGPPPAAIARDPLGGARKRVAAPARWVGHVAARETETTETHARMHRSFRLAKNGRCTPTRAMARF